VDEVDRTAALDGWFRAHADSVLAYLLHRTDRDTAHDVLQEVFVIAFRKADVVPEPPIGWLFGTARRVLANTLRSQRRRDQLLDRLAEDAAATADTDLAELKGAFAATMRDLSDADREVLTLSGWYGLSPTDAALALGCSPNAYAVRLHRARGRLADRLRTAGYTGETPAGLFAEALRG
jgi:RNA polymerase sigma-70 factor, ECF subfamily